eukprot:1319392-Amorphochlora_amoeboformis.AAC.1
MLTRLRREREQGVGEEITEERGSRDRQVERKKVGEKKKEYVHVTNTPKVRSRIWVAPLKKIWNIEPNGSSTRPYFSSIRFRSGSAPDL